MKQSLRKNKSFLFLFMIFLYPAISNYIWKILSFVLTINYDVFNAIIWAVFLLFSLPFLLKNISKNSLIFYLVSCFLLLVFYAFTSYAQFTFENFLTLVFLMLPMVFFGSAIKFEEEFFKPLYWLSVAVLGISIAYNVYFMFSGRELETDNMGMAYRVLPAVLFIISGCFYHKKKLLDIILSVIAVLFLFALGTRGPLLCVIVFIGIMAYKKLGLSKFVIAFLVLVCLLGVFVASSLYTRTLSAIGNALEKAGYSSRITEMMKEGTISSDNGRNAIEEVLLEDLNKDPTAIRGPYSDRDRTEGLNDAANYITYEDGTYAHNLFLELVYDYGIIIGGVLVIAIVVIVLRFIVNCNKKNCYVIAAIICCGFIHLLVSGSYLTSQPFFLLIGLAFNPTLMKSKQAVQNEKLAKVEG